MADRFVDLQHHLLRHQQQIHLAGRAVRRGEQFERLLRDAFAGAVKTRVIEHFNSALATVAIVLAAKAAGLRIRSLIGGYRQIRHHVAEMLLHVGAVGGQIQLRRVRDAERRIPVDDARIGFACMRFAHQQFDQFLAR